MRRKTTVWMVAATVVCAWGVGSCDDSDPLASGILNLTLSVTPDEVAIGESVEVRATASGTDLVGLIIEFGDGRVDSIAALGAVTQEVRITDHSYSTSGTYQVTARVEDNILGTVVRSSVVTVRDP